MVIVQSLRTHNRSRLMRLILERGVMSRSEFASASGLSKVTSTAIVSELLEQGWLRELGKTEGLAGRPAALVELHPQAGTVLGLDLQPEGVALLAGNLVTGGEMVLTHHPLEDAQTITEAVLGVLEQARLEAPHGPLLHATLALPAPVGLDGWPAHPSRLPDLEPARLFAWAERHDLTLTLENDIKLATLAEFERGAAQGYGDFALLVERQGGVALGLFLEGRLYRGAQGHAGELSLMGWPHDGRVEPLETLALEVREQALVQVCAALAVALDLSHFLIHQSAGGASALDLTTRLPTLVLCPIEVSVSHFGDAGPVHGALLQAARLAQNRLFGLELE